MATLAEVDALIELVCQAIGDDDYATAQRYLLQAQAKATMLPRRTKISEEEFEARDSAIGELYKQIGRLKNAASGLQQSEIVLAPESGCDY